MKLLFICLMTFSICSAWSQEFAHVSKTAFENAFNSRYLGSYEGKHFVLNYNYNFFSGEIKDIDQDQIDPKPELYLVIYNEQTDFEKKVALEYEYKFQDMLYAGMVGNQIRLIYTSRKAKGTVLENFDLSGAKKDFQMLSEDKKNNFIKTAENNKFILYFNKENCYVYDDQMKNLDKFPFQTDSILEIVNYMDGFLMTHRKDGAFEIIQFSPVTGTNKYQKDVSESWICKSPRIAVDEKRPERFYLTYLIGKVVGRKGGWDFLDTRIDNSFRSKGINITIFNSIKEVAKERSILFESNLVYATNPNANREQNLGCTNLKNLGIRNFKNGLLLFLEEQFMDRKETINQLTGAKKVSHKFEYHDIILIKLEENTSIQNFLIKACETNMDENQLGSFYCNIRDDKIDIFYNQTYIREKKHKLFNVKLDMYLEEQNKTLNDDFNQHGLNLVLNPEYNYVKSKYFLALQNGFLDLTLLQN